MKTFPNSLLDAMRQIGDPLADEAAEVLFAHPEAANMREKLSQMTFNQEDLSEDFPLEMKALYEESMMLPSWADQKKIAISQLFFAAHVQPIMGLLGSYALPYCYAAADGAQVLYLSERVRYDTRRRLAETGKFVFEVLEKGAFSPEGKGLRAIAQVRLVHAAIRHHILKIGNWEKSWGIPVNQEDMAGTGLAFSFIILRGLRKIGYAVSAAEADAFLHTWKIINYLLGSREEMLCDTAKEAWILAQKIEKRHFKESDAGKSLTKALLENYKELKVPMPEGYIPAYMRFLLGDKVADLLNIPPSNWTKSLIAPVTLLNMAKSMSIPFKEENIHYQSVEEVKKKTVEQLENVKIEVPKGVGERGL